MLDNYSVAVMTLVNGLAERYGMEPCDFGASISSEHESIVLSFDSPPSDDSTSKQFERMLGALALDQFDPVLQGSHDYVYRKLNAALQTAPKGRMVR